MSDIRDEPGGMTESAAPTASPPPRASSEAELRPLPARQARSHIGLIASLAVILVLLLTSIAASPFWAPHVMPLLPWNSQDTSADAAMSRRLDAIEQRLAAAEAGEAQLKSALDSVSGRLDRAETARSTAQQSAASQGQQLEQRIAALETKVAAFPAMDPAALTAMQQDLRRLDGAVADMATRLASLEKAANAVRGADETDAALTLSLLQIREAVQLARPFADEYDAFVKLARNRPDIAAAAAALAEPAKQGIASRALLTRQLDDLERQIATASTPVAGDDWTARAWTQLRGLITIRRVGSAAPGGPEATIETARQALAAGDLAGAIAAIAGLNGADAAAAEPWLRMARARLQVEAALDKLQQLLLARLGNPPTVPGSPS
ncbi:MAG: hypothetical protein JO267_02310 [Alphaproteobacteria bacterium]|nr:hypothetical protein [Alphaproteobacteria bacterium]